MKKLLSLLLTFVMIFSFMTAPVSAAGSSSGLEAEGVIYLNGMHDNIVYKLYKVFDLESVSADGTSFSYNIDLSKGTDNNYTDPWAYFLKENEIAKKYLVVDNNGGITKTSAFTGDEATIELAKAAIAYASSNHINAFATSELAGDPPSNVYFEKTATGGMFKNLPAGYYLFESAVGTLGALVTARPNVPAYISVKNNIPTLTKDVFEDSTSSWLAYNSADIGQEIMFRATIDAQAGAENYSFHDKMEGMELWTDTNGNYKIKVTHHKNKFGEGELQNEELVAKTESNNKYDYEVKVAPHEGVTFGIKFTQSFCDEIKANDKIIIEYSAVLTKEAKIADIGNKNSCVLAYGAMNGAEPSFKTAEAKTYTHTYGVDIVKTNNSGESIPGAKFNLYPALPNGTIDEEHPIKFTYDETKQAYYVDPVAGKVEFTAGAKDYVGQTNNGQETITGKFSVATLMGLDNGTYYIRETAAPSGYNMLTDDMVFTISSTNIKATFKVEKVTSDSGSTVKTTYTGGGFHVVNQKGDKLPETGGAGTTLFITLGTITVLGAGVLLVTKKRMSMIED